MSSTLCCVLLIVVSLLEQTVYSKECSFTKKAACTIGAGTVGFVGVGGAVALAPATIKTITTTKFLWGLITSTSTTITIKGSAYTAASVAATGIGSAVGVAWGFCGCD